MEPMDEAFREGLRDAVSNQPAMAPIALDEVLARAARPAARQRPLGRWIGLAAAVTLAAGLGLWTLQSSTRVPAERVVAPTFGDEVRTLRVRNDTPVAYRDIAVRLSDGRTLALGDVPAGGTVAVPMEAPATPGPSVQVEPSGTATRVYVVYSGDCSSSSGQLQAVVLNADGTIIAIAGPSAPPTPSPAAESGFAPACTITITEGEPTPEATPS